MIDFHFSNGLVVCLLNDKFVPVITGDATQIQQAILSDIHGSALGGHLGWQKDGCFSEE